MHARRAVAGVAVVAAAAMTVTACGGGEASPTAADEGSKLVFGLQATPQSLDPYLSEGGGNYPYLAPLYDSLIRLDADGQMQPGLATSWEYSQDRLSFTMDLRADVTFSDGEAFDAEAVKANLDRAAVVEGPRTSQLAGIEEVTADDADTVTIHLAAPNPSLTTILADVLGMMASPAALDDLAANPVGTGPYVMDAAATRADDTYTYVKRDDYWDADHYHFSSIVLRVIPDENTLYQAIRSGEVDGAVALNAMVEQAESDGLQVAKSPVNFSGMFLFDREGTEVPALGDVRVRQALNYAVDRQAIVDSVANGLGTPTSQILAPGLPGHVDALDTYYTYDPEKAKSLLAEAGYADGFTMRALSSTFLGLDAQVQLLASYFEAIGVTVEIETLQPGDYIPGLIAGQAPAGQFLWGAQDVTLDSANLTAPTGAFNPFGASNEDMNALIADAALADEETRLKLYEEWNTMVTEEAWFVVTHFQDVSMILDPDLTGIQWWPNRATPSFYDWSFAEQS